ncbi:MAG: hypothetical protein H0U26_09185 [Acidimicrobiia bacterium]|nr:hypothetical protein [Acidimicrobiia bacterium]
MVKSFNKVLLVLLVVIVFLAWADGRDSAVDFASSAGRVTGDVVSAVVEFFDGLAENKPSTSGT